ncbi:hypothetical protein HH308_14910 [Gordonia sp. TBRC 11910]|uniref:Uncharacterized protein n=1 Tax=Gordonia asplenii TaxID=2725283 RepID=A0A848KUE0_9ACTN|nr:hypothetical protein [Gordonia asplenii]NMO02504.1 hypothetical protein [Gordonia asplenii]
MIEEMQADADELEAHGEYVHALAEYSVLREIRGRREGPYSPMYLANLHSCVRCMYHLELWSDSMPLCKELHGKYIRTHGRAQQDTVEVAKLWAWAMLHVGQLPPALTLYLSTADALWDDDPMSARRLIGAVAAHRVEVNPTPLIDAAALRHSLEVVSTLNDLIESVAADASSAKAALTVDGLQL